MDWYCPQCCGEGEIVHNLTEEPVFVVCSNCGYEDAYVWCEKCGVGGQISITDFNSRPMEWVCRFCGSKYQLPPNFYEAPMTFTPTAFSARPFRSLPPGKKFAHVSPTLLREFLIHWNGYREKVWLTYIFLFILIVGFPSVHKPTGRLFLMLGQTYGYLIVVILWCMPVLYFFDIASWIAEKIIFRRKQASCRKTNHPTPRAADTATPWGAGGGFEAK